MSRNIQSLLVITGLVFASSTVIAESRGDLGNQHILAARAKEATDQSGWQSTNSFDVSGQSKRFFRTFGEKREIGRGKR